MAKKQKEEVQQDTNAWITTYTDLMTLLLTFFVLLLSISTIDDRRKREALNSLVGAFGFKPAAQAVLGEEKGTNITMGSAPMTKEDVNFSQLQNLVFKNGLEGDVKVSKSKDRLVITLSDRVLFSYGSSRIESRFSGFLLGIAQVLKNGPSLVELRGFADPSETFEDEDPFRKGMLLSAERSMAVLRFFKDRGKIPVDRLVAHGFGTPRRAGALREKARFNRQVEIICDFRTRLPYHLRKKVWTRDFSLDFKGFLFKLTGEKDE